MGMNWSNFDHSGEAWGVAQPELRPGEYNVRIVKAEEKDGVLRVTYEATAPEAAKGRTITEQFTTDAQEAKRSAKAEEVSLKRLKGLLQTCKAPKASPPPAWVGCVLAIIVAPREGTDYVDVKRYMPPTPNPLGERAASVNAKHTGAASNGFDDDGIPF